MVSIFEIGHERADASVTALMRLNAWAGLSTPIRNLVATPLVLEKRCRHEQKLLVIFNFKFLTGF